MHDHSDPARRHAIPMPRGLYLITPDEPDDARLAGAGRSRCSPMRRCLQYRNKRATARCSAGSRPTRLRSLCAMRAFRFIVNDDAAPRRGRAAPTACTWANTMAPIATARALLGDDAIIGVSCYDDLAARARRGRAGRGLPRVRRVLPVRRPSPMRAVRRSTCCRGTRRSACRVWRSAA